MFKMGEIEKKINSTDQENASILFGYVKKAAEMTHTVIMAERKSRKAVSAIQSQDKSIKWMILQEYLKEYGTYINETTPLTGVQVYPVDKEFYDTVEIREIDQQLQIVIGIVYLKDAAHSVAKESFKECLKKLLKKSGILTETQLNFI